MLHCCYYVILFFFFKQKTAYEMRISDWSSDVCSSDLGWMHRAWGGEVKVFVDTAPLMEKPLSAAAGLGWQGRHTNLVSRDFGSWLCLGQNGSASCWGRECQYV